MGKPLPMELGIQAGVSPDGKQVAFVWAGDVWVGSTNGGQARQLTQHPGQEWTPKFSPDGKEIAFVSDREGSLQVYVVPVKGGEAVKLTDHSEGYYLLGWDPDGKSLLARGRRDAGVGRNTSRLLRISRGEFGVEESLFDAYADRADISPDGQRVLFTREGVDLYRKGYRGSQAAQIWSYDFGTRKFALLVDDDGGARSPMWKPDGSGFYYVAQRGGTFNLIGRDLASGAEVPLTDFDDDGVLRPAISRDGKVIVFRRGVDFYRLRLGADAVAGGHPDAEKLVFRCASDIVRGGEQRRMLESASEVVFSDDGLEIAFVAGGDVWVMDTVLREPVRLTETAAEEREVTFSKDGAAIYYLSDSGVDCRLWRAEKADGGQFWWQNSEFDREQVDLGGDVISAITISPDGKRLGFVEGRGDLWLADLDGKNPRRVLESWSQPRYDWSPDSAWLAYSVSDNDFNEDVWIVPVDGSMLPYNVSRHPDYEGHPRWSPDGKLLAFTGRRHSDEIDMYYVWLQREDDELDRRDRSEEKALEKMKQGRKAAVPGAPDPSAAAGSAKGEPPAEPLKGWLLGLKRLMAQPGEAGADTAEKRETSDQPTPATGAAVAIDFEGLASRVRRISIPDAQEQGLFWSSDSKKLAFSATVKGVAGVYSVEFPDNLEPALVVAKQVTAARWLAKDEQLVWLERGVPGSFVHGTAENYSFRAAHSFDQEAKFRVAFLQIWRAMRDYFYDGAHGGRDWDQVRGKYEEAAAAAVDLVAFENVIAMLLGELNGSHLGFYASPGARGAGAGGTGAWAQVTGHLGVEWRAEGGKLVVAAVLPGGPADREASKLEPGDVLISAGGVGIAAEADLLPVLNGVAGQRVEIVVERGGEELAPLRIPTISYAAARDLHKRAWIEANRREVERLSGGRLGYLYVARMMWDEFENFEREIFAIGAGKDGIVIDVRDNGGGFTADHLLTVLTPAQHALTVPRGGGPGYPGDRRVYGTWSKPIVVLCNQNSFSNAEIFSHAVKSLGRGKLVGVPTAGGVISTGATSILDIGTLRMPFRGWFKLDDGEDMELNGAVPDFIIWPEPGEIPAGIDRQLRKAVDVLAAEVAADLAKPRPGLRRASERR